MRWNIVLTSNPEWHLTTACVMGRSLARYFRWRTLDIEYLVRGTTYLLVSSWVWAASKTEIPWTMQVSSSRASIGRDVGCTMTACCSLSIHEDDSARVACDVEASEEIFTHNTPSIPAWLWEWWLSNEFLLHDCEILQCMLSVNVIAVRLDLKFNR